LRLLEEWLSKLTHANTKSGVYAADALARTIEKRWWAACRSNVGLGSGVWTLYSKSPLAEVDRSLACKAMFFAKAHIYGFMGTR
jgi:hypothetical protein